MNIKMPKKLLPLVVCLFLFVCVLQMLNSVAELIRVERPYALRIEPSYYPVVRTPRRAPPWTHENTTVSNTYNRQFRKIGFLTSRELSDPIILPLFGEVAPFRRHRWNYYTITDANNASSIVKLPVIFRDRDCTSEVACDEIYGEDIVRVHGYDSPFVVHVY